jgi:hypothetical protein
VRRLPDCRHLLDRISVKEQSPAWMHGYCFSGKLGELSATSGCEVLPALRLLEERVKAGQHAAGFISYEAAGALNGDLTTRAADGLPLLWFGLYEKRSAEPLAPCSEPFHTSNWQHSLDRPRFAGAVTSVRDLIEAGDCYQVNLTMRQRFCFSGSPLSFFQELRRGQPTPYGCYLESGNYRVLSVSPELFFSLKDGVLTTRPASPAGRPFHVYEDGYFLLQRHLERLTCSAAYFAFPLEPGSAERALLAAVPSLSGRQKVRLLLEKDGSLNCEWAPVAAALQQASAAFANTAVDSTDPFLYHKTTWRRLYREEAAARPELSEVIFCNERGEVTEGATSNIVALIDGALLTPPVSSGLLPGVLREELLANGSIGERVLTRCELEEAEEIYLINSVRKWRRVRLVG